MCSNVIVLCILCNVRMFVLIAFRCCFGQLFMIYKTTCISYHYRSYHSYGSQFPILSQLTLSVSQSLTVIQCACVSEGQEREVGISCYHNVVFSQSILFGLFDECQQCKVSQCDSQ